MATSAIKRINLERDIASAPGYLYTEVPKPGEYRYVFEDKTCLSIREAWEHAKYLQAIQ